MFSSYIEKAKRAQRMIGSNYVHTDLTKGAMIERLRNAYWVLDSLIYDLENTMLLFPDMSRTQHEAQEFCFADPCTLTEWQKLLKEDASIPDGYLPFCYKQSDEEEICLILRDKYDTDDDCLTTAAWIRMVREFTGMIYALPYSDRPALTATPMANIIARTSGVPFFQVRHIEV